MKVVLINSPRMGFYFGRQIPPLGLLYLSSYAKSCDLAAEIQLVDLGNNSIPLEEAVARIIALSPDVVAMNLFWEAEEFALALFRELRLALPSIRIIVGGPHATANYGTLIRTGCIDIIVRGEGEITFVQLLQRMIEQRSLKDVPGLALKNGDTAHLTSMRTLISDLDSLPFPDYSLLSPSDRCAKLGFIVASRGCRYSCSFCLSPVHWGPGARVRKAESLVKELEWLQTKLGVHHVFFWDDNFPTNLEFLSAFTSLQKTISPPMTFTCYCRPEELTPITVPLLAAAGCKKIRMGIETAEPVILHLMRKPTVSAAVIQAISLCRNWGIKSHLSFQIGFPDETTSSISKTLDFAKRLQPDFAYFYFFTPYPGTQIYKDITHTQETFTNGKRHLLSPSFQSNGFDAAALRGELLRCYQEFYSHVGFELPRSVVTRRAQGISSQELIESVYAIQDCIYSEEDDVKW